MAVGGPREHSANTSTTRQRPMNTRQESSDPSSPHKPKHGRLTDVCISMPQATCAIETQNLSRRFGSRVAVQRLELRVAEGSIYGFLGLNGAGKTTTIRLLLGLIRPDEGRVEIFGRPFRHDVLGRVGCLVEVPSLYSHLTGRENLEVTRRQVAASRASVDRALATVGLTHDAGRLVREYSLGMKQRIGLALALLNTPDLLILDEPTNGLDPAGIHEIRDLLRRLPAQYGVTVFLSSHLLSEVEQVAGVVGIIHEGRLLFQGPLADLRSRRSRRLRIGVRETASALRLLRSAGFVAHLDEPDFVIVETQSLDADRINRLLVENDQRVFQLTPQDESLEDIFLSMTEGRAHG
jgi:lantibiotic transport system ATP-binding protein